MMVAIIVISILVAFWLITIKYKKELKKWECLYVTGL